MSECLIAIGSNLGDPRNNIRQATRLLDDVAQTQVIQLSDLLETAPVGNADRQFLNAAVKIETGLNPETLIQNLLALEKKLGRDRKIAPGNRSVDLDIILFDQLVLTTKSLIVPHPRMSFRRFVLEPAVQVAAEMVHPFLQQTVKQLLTRLDDADNLIGLIVKDEHQVSELKSLIDLELNLKSNLQTDDCDQIWTWSNSQRAQFANSTSNSGEPDWRIDVSFDSTVNVERRQEFKLLMTCNPDHSDVDHNSSKLVRGGPYWDVSELANDEIYRAVQTAIMSMNPL